MKQIFKNQKGILVSGITLGAGNLILGSMGQGNIASKISGPGSTMLGVATSANMGMGIMNFVNKKSKRKSF